MSEYNEYEDVCFVCRRPESKTGKMFHLPGDIAICDDCMHRTMDAVSQMEMKNPELMKQMMQYGNPFMAQQMNVEKEKPENVEKKESEEDAESVEDIEAVTDEETEQEEEQEDKSKNNGFSFGGFPNISFVNLSDLQEGMPGRKERYLCVG